MGTTLLHFADLHLDAPFEHLWTISPVENTKVPVDWDADEVIELFGTTNFEKDER